MIEYPENDGGPKPYLLWDLQSYERLDAQVDQHNKVTVVLHQITCSVSQSFPTGDNNLALLEVFNTYQSMSGGLRPGFASASQGMKGYSSHNIRRRQAPFGRGGHRGQHTYQQKNRNSGSGQANSKRKNRNATDKSNRRGANEDTVADNNDDAGSEAPSSDEDNHAGQATTGAVGAAGEARRPKNVRFADQREGSHASMGASSPIQGQGQGGAGWDEDVDAYDAHSVEEGDASGTAANMDFPPLPRDDVQGDPVIQSSESFGARDLEDEDMGVVPGPSAPMTSAEPEEQLPSHSVQI